jgi:hypothetical protein
LLICKYGHVMNTRICTVAADLVIEHIGAVPDSISNHVI